MEFYKKASNKQILIINIEMLLLIILYGLIASFLFILTSWWVAKSGEVKNNTRRILVMITGIMFLGGMVLVIPFIPQPRLDNNYLQYYVGIPLAILGMLFRVYPMIHLKQHVPEQIWELPLN
ncbi:MAG: hypothetical protein QME14_01785 [Methanobacteriaceae archaeon]|nr:hypothetical protein [Methanobacteriaceae archaeon]